MDNQVIWNYDINGWKTLTEQLTYPRPQGNIPMFGALKESKQKKLEHGYFNVINK